MITIERYSKIYTPFELEDGFFKGWPNPPSKLMHQTILENSYVSYVAIDTQTSKIIGFVNAISDGVLSSTIPLLEVVEPYQGQGIATQLIEAILDALSHLYMIDVSCDEDLLGFYNQCGFVSGHSAIIRNTKNQNGIG